MIAALVHCPKTPSPNRPIILPITAEMLRLISEVDRYGGEWCAVHGLSLE